MKYKVMIPYSVPKYDGTTDVKLFIQNHDCDTPEFAKEWSLEALRTKEPNATFGEALVESLE